MSNFWENADMWQHFVHLFGRTMHGMPILVSSNWASWGLGFAIFMFYEGFAIVSRGWQDMKARWAQNVGIGLLATACGYLILFICSAIATTYDEHNDSTGRWQAVVKEKDKLKDGLAQRDDYIRQLEARQCPSCPSRKPLGAQPTSLPRALTELQRAILIRDLKAGHGLKVKINVIGNNSDTLAFAKDIVDMFKGWDVELYHFGITSFGFSSPFEFVIPRPQDSSVQIAVHAFDHAHVEYTKNVDQSAFLGAMGTIPPLIINITDR
jgi:hypothetical protein